MLQCTCTLLISGASISILLQSRTAFHIVNLNCCSYDSGRDARGLSCKGCKSLRTSHDCYQYTNSFPCKIISWLPILGWRRIKHRNEGILQIWSQGGTNLKRRKDLKKKKNLIQVSQHNDLIKLHSYLPKIHVAT